MDNIIFYKLKNGSCQPEKHGDWIDLCSDGNYYIREGQYMEIGLGVAMELPENCEALVLPRSSTFRKYGILMANSIGVIDHDFCGDNDYWSFPAYATRDVFIDKGTRLSQFRVISSQDVKLVEVQTLNNPDRGGLGSTD